MIRGVQVCLRAALQGTGWGPRRLWPCWHLPPPRHPLVSCVPQQALPGRGGEVLRCSCLAGAQVRVMCQQVAPSPAGRQAGSRQDQHPTLRHPGRCSRCSCPQQEAAGVRVPRPGQPVPARVARSGGGGGGGGICMERVGLALMDSLAGGSPSPSIIHVCFRV